MYYKGIKIRLLPTTEQEILLWKHIHCSRFIWNYMLALQEQRYKNGEKHLSKFDMIKLLTPLKQDDNYKWLNEVSNSTLQRVCLDLDSSYIKFYNKINNKPKFKSKKNAKCSFPVCDAIGRTYFKNNKVNVQKVGKILYSTKFTIPQGNDKKIINPRILYVGNKWILSFNIICENQANDLKGKMGIDLGIKELAVVSFDNKQIVFHNINKSKKMRTLECKIKHLQRNVSRKYKTNGCYDKTKSILKTENQIKKIKYHIQNIRLNYIHQCTHKLITYYPQKIVMEDLNIKGLLKNRHLSKAIQDQCLYEFIRQMKYKCEWNNIDFIQADKFYPSSKTCSNCGCIKQDLKLSDRIYKCNYCGLIIDRDYNAAINLMNYST